MTISEFEQEFMGHVPEIMGTKAHYAVLVPWWSGGERSKSSLRSGPTPWSGSRGGLLPGRTHGARREPYGMCLS